MDYLNWLMAPNPTVRYLPPMMAYCCVVSAIVILWSL